MGVEYGALNKYSSYGQPSLDLVFTGPKKSLRNRIGNQQVEFTRDSIGTYVDENGIIQTAASGEARFDHDSDGNSLGLLIEESRTNFLYPSTPDYTGGFGNWLFGAAPTVPNAGIAPDGTNTAVRVDWSTVSGAERLIYDTGTPTTVGITEVHSFFVKPVGAGVVFNVTFQGVNWSWLNGSTSTRGFYFDFDSETFYANTLTGYGEVITKLPNGWYRISIQAINNGTGAFDTYVAMQRNVQVGDWYIWGVQRENGSFPTSYIPTSGSTVTRAADVASLTNSSIYDTEAFTIINEPFGVSAGSTSLSLVGPNIKRTTVYSTNLSQTNILNFKKKTDEFWRWQILGSSFGLPSFVTNGQVTVDWGDGTVETLTTSDHTFTDGGGYHEIGFRLDSGTYFRPVINNNATHKDKVVAVGPAPESMTLDGLGAFYGCFDLEAFDATVDATGGASMSTAWKSCIGLTSFPFINTSGVSNFGETWYFCSSLTSFPAIDTSSGTNFTSAWRDCQSLTSFPALDVSSGEDFDRAWRDCFSLTDFPANFFDSWTGTPATGCFSNAWDGCTSLTATSVENILNSIDTSGQSAPVSGVDITIDYNAGSGTPSIATAVTNLKSRGWTITLNGVAQ